MAFCGVAIGKLDISWVIQMNKSTPVQSNCQGKNLLVAQSAHPSPKYPSTQVQSAPKLGGQKSSQTAVLTQGVRSARQ